MTAIFKCVFSLLLIFVPLASKNYAADVKPHLPDSFQSFFMMILELKNNDNISEKAFSIYNGQVIYDNKKQILSIHFENVANPTQYMYEYNSGDFTEINGRKCIVTKIEEKFTFFPFPHFNEAKSEKILLFDGQQDQKNETTWTSKRQLLLDDGAQHDCTIDHIFDDRDDEKKYGVLKNLLIVCGAELNLQLEFMHFVNTVSEPKKLQQPAGVYCQNKNSTFSFPTLPDRFHFMMELAIGLEGNTSSLDFQEVWYDSSFEIVVRDKENEMVHTREVTIKDYKRGVEYFINRQLRLCTMSNLSSSTEMESKSFMIGIVGNTDKAQYVGERMVDGVQHRVWATINDDKSMVSEVSFVQVSNDLGSNYRYIPVKVDNFYRISSSQSQTDINLKIFRFENYPTDWSILDTTYCFNASDQGIRFQLTIEGSDTLPVSQVQDFEEAVHLQLIYILQVTATRISNFEVHHIPNEDYQGFVYGIITENPASYGFGKMPEEGSAEELYRNLLNRVMAKEFSFTLKHDKNVLQFLGKRVERLSKNVRVTNKPDEPKLPSSFQTDFTLYFMSNIYQGAYLYDDKRKIAAVNFDTDIEKNFYIYNFEETEELIIEGRKCTANRIDSETISIFPFGSKTINHKSKGGAESILLFDADSKAFVNEEVNSFQQRYQKWSSNKDISIGGQNFVCALTHWFRVDEDETKNLEVIDVQCMYPENAEDAIDFTFHFSQFSPDIKDSERFQQPFGIFCDKKSRIEEPPKLPDRFRIGRDNFAGFDSGKVAVSSSSEIWYDVNSQLIRQEERSSLANLHTVTITDYKMGVGYYLNILGQSCQITKLPESQRTIYTKENVLGMERGYSKFQYVGQKKMDSVNYYVWAFASEDLVHVADISYIKEGSSNAQFYAPVRIDEYNYVNEMPQHSSRRFFNYEVNPDDWSIFDVTSCFNADQQIPFQLTIKGSEKTPNTDSILTEVKKQIQQTLLDIMKISVVRISRFQISHLKNDSFIASGVLTESPTALGAGTDQSDPSAKQAFQNLVDSIHKSFKFKINADKVINYEATKLESPSATSCDESQTTKLSTDDESGTTKSSSDGEEPTKSSSDDEHMTKSPLGEETAAVKYSPGSMAALGICMIALGGVIGAALLAVYIKYKQRKNDGLTHAINADL